MKAAYIRQTGPPENIVYGDLPTPEPAAGQVLVRVEAVSVNPIDTYLRSGAVAMPLPFPFVVGSDLAGTVEKVGAEARHFRPGDRVWGSTQGLLGRQGTFAEYAAVDEHWLYRLPAEVSAEAAAAVALVGITAHLGLLRDARLQRGEIIFVNGGSGGVGSMVVQMAKILGARVVTTAGSDEGLELCRGLGADLALNYKQDDLAARVREFAPQGVNVWWETVRDPNFDVAILLLAERGRMVLMAGRDARPVFPVGPFYVKQCSLHGLVMFKATPQEERASADDMNRWLSSGALKPHIGARLPLAETAEAHRLQEASTIHKAGTLRGKIVLTP